MTVTVIDNCRLFDPRAGEFFEPRYIAIEAGRIREVSDQPIAVPGARRIDAGGRSVLPGLIDAHFHAYGADLDVRKLDAMPRSLLAQYGRKSLEDALQRGFTTVRDAAGADIGLKMAIDRGLIAGPRLYFSGLAISQTGGHGDPRAADDEPPCLCSYSGALTCVADGACAVRLAAREQLRRGATQIKIFVSGGVISSTDPIWMPQLTVDEIRAAVEEASSRRSYVMAHAHTSEAARRCVENGVRSIEHATIIDRQTAEFLAKRGAFVVPTLTILHLLAEDGRALGLSESMLGKAAEVNRHARNSLELLREAGARIGFGTDLLGSLMDRQSDEFAMRRDVMGAAEVLRSATIVNAELLGESGRLGEILPGAHADLLILDDDPLADIAVLSDPARLLLVMSAGVIRRNLMV